MLRTVLAALFAIVLLADGSAFSADDTFTLKLYKSKKGDKTSHEKVETGKTTVTVNVGGMNMDMAMPSSSKEAFTEEILEKKEGDKIATKMTRTYTVAEKTDKGETTKAVYAGKTVLIEKKGNKYELSIDGKALKESDAPEMYKKFNKQDDEPDNEDFLPKDPVKVGGGWKVAADKSEKMFKSLSDDKMKVDAKKSSIEGKLLKAYKKDGAQFGVIELTFTLFITELDLGGQFVKTAGDSKMVLKGVIDTCIDGTLPSEESKFEMTIHLGAELPNNASLVVTGSMKGTETVRPAKK
jgi:hypothetical protein